MQLLNSISADDMRRALELVARYYDRPRRITLGYDGLRPVALKRPFDVRRAKDAR